MIEKNFAEEFARNWITAWNSHDLERILSHYSDQFESLPLKSSRLQGSRLEHSRARMRSETLPGRSSPGIRNLFPRPLFQETERSFPASLRPSRRFKPRSII